MAPLTTAWQLGVSSGALITLPEPDMAIDASIQRIGGNLTSISGSQTIQVVGRKRQFQLSWTNLRQYVAGPITYNEYNTVIQFWNGVQGVGPFVLGCPFITTFLTVNVTDCSENWKHLGVVTVTMTLQEV